MATAPTSRSIRSVDPEPVRARLLVVVKIKCAGAGGLVAVSTRRTRAVRGSSCGKPFGCRTGVGEPCEWPWPV